MEEAQSNSGDSAAKLKFRSVLPSFPDGKPVTGAEAEAFFLKQIDAAGESGVNALYQLSAIYMRSGRLKEAEECVNRLIEMNTMSGGTAVHLLQLGQIAELRNDYETAAVFYQRGLEAGPVHKHTRYFLRNNLGFSLFILRRFTEAEPLLREAILIDPDRPNAYKNLGLALWGISGRTAAYFAGVAECFIDATRVNAADGRALRLLEKLYRVCPKIAGEISDFEIQLEACRQAVAGAARHRPDLKAWWKKCREEAEKGKMK